MSLFGIGGSRPPPPAPPPLPAPLPTPPSYASNQGSKGGPAGGMNKIPGFGSTLLTSPLGADESQTNTGKKSLLGQ